MAAPWPLFSGDRAWSEGRAYDLCRIESYRPPVTIVMMTDLCGSEHGSVSSWVVE